VCFLACHFLVVDIKQSVKFCMYGISRDGTKAVSAKTVKILSQDEIVDDSNSECENSAYSIG